MYFIERVANRRTMDLREWRKKSWSVEMGFRFIICVPQSSKYSIFDTCTITTESITVEMGNLVETGYMNSV